jgi:hypothetical protein
VICNVLWRDNARTSTPSIIFQSKEHLPTEWTRNIFGALIGEKVGNVENVGIMRVKLRRDTFYAGGERTIASHGDSTPPFVSNGTVGESDDETRGVVIEELVRVVGV